MKSETNELVEILTKVTKKKQIALYPILILEFFFGTQMGHLVVDKSAGGGGGSCGGSLFLQIQLH